jgi:hypothetical protein
MAHDRMTNDDLDRNMGRAGQDDDLGKQDFGKQTPGRNPNDQQSGQKGAGQRKPTDDEENFGTGGGAGKTGGNPGQQQNK